MSVNIAIIEALGLPQDASVEDIATKIEELRGLDGKKRAWSIQIDSYGRLHLYRTGIRFFAEDVNRLRRILRSSELQDVLDNGDLATRKEYHAARAAVRKKQRGDL